MAKNSSSTPPFLPSWVKWLIGGIIIFFIVLIQSRSLFISGWAPLHSSFLENGLDALEQSDISMKNSPIPTLLVFWHMDCEVCKLSLSWLSKQSIRARIIGVYIGATAQNKNAARLWWVTNGPKKASLYFDKQTLLETTFEVYATPANFLIYSKEHIILTSVGHLEKSLPPLDKLVKDHQLAL